MPLMFFSRHLFQGFPKTIFYFGSAPYTLRINNNQLDLAFNNVKPKDWYFVLD